MNDYYRKCAYPKQQAKKKKRGRVTDETYYKVWNSCNGTCQLCGSRLSLQLHHIRYRSERRDLINEPQNCIMLCLECHLKVHGDKKYWQPKLLERAKELYEKESII